MKPSTIAAMLGLDAADPDAEPRVVQMIDLADPRVRAAFLRMQSAVRSENPRAAAVALDELDAAAVPTLLSDLQPK